jgi:hypothetical protein
MLDGAIVDTHPRTETEIGKDYQHEHAGAHALPRSRQLAAASSSPTAVDSTRAEKTQTAST